MSDLVQHHPSWRATQEDEVGQDVLLGTHVTQANARWGT